ncbi:MAG TPA: hypothetical protein VGM36_07275, partial [Rhizomicrobium sp.]
RKLQRDFYRLAKSDSTAFTDGADDVRERHHVSGDWNSEKTNGIMAVAWVVRAQYSNSLREMRKCPAEHRLFIVSNAIRCNISAKHLDPKSAVRGKQR